MLFRSAALKVDPGDPGELSTAMERVLSSSDLSRELSARGLERAAKFSWVDAAQKTLQVYNEVLEGEGSACS